MSSSPPRSRGDGEKRPRFFDSNAKAICWSKADIVPGRHPERWRKDAAGNIVCKRFYNCIGCLCYEYDHIIPFSKGGESTADNCQILQSRVNRLKSDKYDVDSNQLKDYSCEVNFTDKELDIIEMAVYGDVVRPGNQCRCRTIAEKLGKFKPKDDKDAWPPPPPPPFQPSTLTAFMRPPETSLPFPPPPPPPPPPFFGQNVGSLVPFPSPTKSVDSSMVGETSVSLTLRTTPFPFTSTDVTLDVSQVGTAVIPSQPPPPPPPPSAPEFDFSELEKLFSLNVPKPADAGGKSGGKGKSAGSKTDRVTLVDLRRANNTEIMLTKVKMPLPDMMAAVLALDESVLDVDQVENLIKFCPTKEEMDLIKAYTGDKELLGKCEQFFIELMKVPRVESKLRVFAFKIQFGAQLTEFKKSLNTVNSACEEVRHSAKLKEIMKKILYLGNTLNQGTARGSAVGFKLDSLLKLTDTRASNSKMTLMHYLCKVLAEKSPKLLDFHLDLVSLEDSTKIQLKSLAEEMQAIIKGLEKVKQEFAASANDGPVSAVFHEKLKEFIGVSESEVASLTNLYSVVGRNADALALYFGEDPARCPFEQVTTTLLNFIRLFRKAHEENCKQAELEKKKAEKEAEMEKAKGVNLTKKGAKDS